MQNFLVHILHAYDAKKFINSLFKMKFLFQKGYDGNIKMS